MKKEINLMFIILAIVSIILTIANFSFFYKNSKLIKETNDENKSDSDWVKQEDLTEEQKNQEILSKLKGMGERDRMEFYIGEYIEYVEQENYEKAYELLYPEFRNNYFKTIDDYKKYAKETYPSGIIMNYSNIERQGEYYVVFVDIIDEEDSSKKISQNIVVKENNYNDFYLSFDVNR